MNKKLNNFLKFLGIGILYQTAIFIGVNIFFLLFDDARFTFIFWEAHFYLCPVIALVLGLHAAALLALGNIKERDDLKEKSAILAGLFVSAALPWLALFLLLGGGE